MKPESPNLFEFASSELSQDAFICWLLSWANSNTDMELSNCAKSLIVKMYNLKNPHDQINTTDVSSIVEIERQEFKIDILLSVNIKNENIVFIIEDKTNTSHHSNQLERYRDAIIKEKKISEDRIHAIYFKTGYIFPEDEKVIEHGYRILTADHFLKILKSCLSGNDIFQDYFRNLTKIVNSRKDVIGNLSSGDATAFKYDYAQIEYLKRILAKLKVSRDIPELHTDRIEHLYNLDGSPLTTLTFLFNKDLYGNNLHEFQFLRIDNRKISRKQDYKYYIAIRQYADITNPDDLKKKMNRLRISRDAFSKIADPRGLQFGKISNRGKKECEIATIFFDNDRNSLSNVLEKLPLIVNEYIQDIKKTGQF